MDRKGDKVQKYLNKIDKRNQKYFSESSNM